MKMHQWFCAVVTACVMALLPLHAADTGITSQQADTIIRELDQIRAVLGRLAAVGAVRAQSQKPSGPIKLSLTGEMMLGAASAPVTVVEYTDYQCPFCNRFYTDVFGKVKENFIDRGKVRFYSRDLPLDIHQNAMRAAEAGRCAGELGHFWQMRDWMSANPTKLDIDTLVDHARDLGMDAKVFRNCVDSGKYKAAIENDMHAAMDVGASGTPAFVIGKSTPDGVYGELVLRVLPLQAFEQKLNDLLDPK